MAADPFEVGQGRLQHVMRDLGGVHAQLEPLLQLLPRMDVVPEVPDLIGVLRDVFAKDAERVRHRDEFRERPGVHGLHGSAFYSRCFQSSDVGAGMGEGQLRQQAFESAADEEDHGQWSLRREAAIDLVEAGLHDLRGGQLFRESGEVDVSEVLREELQAGRVGRRSQV
jgi:hypothetical protein